MRRYPLIPQILRRLRFGEFTHINEYRTFWQAHQGACATVMVSPGQENPRVTTYIPHKGLNHLKGFLPGAPYSVLVHHENWRRQLIYPVQQGKQEPRIPCPYQFMRFFKSDFLCMTTQNLINT